MSDVKISALPTKTVAGTDMVPVVDAAATTTSRVTAGAIAAIGGGPPAAHKTTHATGGTDALTAADIGAAASSHNQAWSTITSTPTTLSGYGITDAVGSSDSRLSDSRTPTAHKTSHAVGGSDTLSASDIGAAAASHSHGNITSDGKIGSTSGLPLITTTSGAVTVGSFGTSSGTFCQGSDSRLSDSRTPTAHKSSHAIGGGDVLSPSDIGAPASSTTGITGATAVTNIVFISQANYDALGSKDSSTMYVIT